MLPQLSVPWATRQALHPRWDQEVNQIRFQLSAQRARDYRYGGTVPTTNVCAGTIRVDSLAASPWKAAGGRLGFSARHSPWSQQHYVILRFKASFLVTEAIKHTTATRLKLSH